MFRSILAALVVALFAAPALADRPACQVIANAINPTEAGATNDIINLADGSFSATAADEDEFVVPVLSEATSLRVDVDVAPTADDTWLISLADDGTVTGLACSITGATDTSCTSGNLGATIAAGSDLTVIVDSSTGTADPAAAAELRFSFCLETK